jgi:hypothetical protein
MGVYGIFLMFDHSGVVQIRQEAPFLPLQAYFSRPGDLLAKPAGCLSLPLGENAVHVCIASSGAYALTSKAGVQPDCGACPACFG